LADLANQAILNKFSDEKNVEITSLVKDYEGVSLLGPNSLVVANSTSTKYNYFSFDGFRLPIFHGLRALWGNFFGKSKSNFHRFKKKNLLGKFVPD